MRDLSRSSGVSGHGSFLDRNYYNQKNESMNQSNRSGSRSRGLQNILNRSGSRSRFFPGAKRGDDRSGSRGNQIAGHRFGPENSRVEVSPRSEVTAGSQNDTKLVQALHREFTDVVKSLQDDTGNLFLVDIL